MKPSFDPRSWVSDSVSRRKRSITHWSHDLDNNHEYDPESKLLLHKRSADNVADETLHRIKRQSKLNLCQGRGWLKHYHDVMTWKQFSHYRPFVNGFHRSHLDPLGKRPVTWRRVDVSLMNVWTNVWTNSRFSTTPHVTSLYWWCLYKMVILLSEWDVTIGFGLQGDSLPWHGEVAP